MKKYTLAFIFDTSLEHVLLIHKLSPDWQKGLLNGVGGKIEEGETSIACIIREVQEETTLAIKEENWIYLGHHAGPDWYIDTFTAIYKGNQANAKKGDKEEVEWFAVNNLPENCLSNLSWLIPFAKDKILTPNLQSYSVTYK